ncbi:MAG: Flp pilus assembly complex ATPase component TadA [Candidatus Yanofskybacteria bacterium]|nr:Flp pilus assembly complex ATPase component TadA [Candidatus Yanofskybacteria bacterium]
MPYQLPQLLIEELEGQGLLSPDVLSDAEKEAIAGQKDLGDILVRRGLIGDADLLKIKSRIYQLPVIDLSGIEIDREVIKDIPENIISYYKILPFARDNSALKVGIIDPENIDALEAVKFIASDRDLSLEKYLISYKDFNNLSKSVRTLTVEVGRALEQLSEGASQKELKITEKIGGLEEITAEAPVTRIVAIVVKHAVETRASDIHIEPFEDKLRLRFRIDGVLRAVLSLPTNLLSALVTRIKILSDLKIDETRLAQDGRFSTKVGDRRVDFRVSTFPTRNGEKVVLRILDPQVGDIKLTDLGLEGRSLDLVRENMVKPFGEILITGPTGSGKSTTLAAVLREINDEEVNIVTLEDPIEYYIEGVNQSQTHEEIGYTFASGLRHILRQDPDIIMVGEIRDSETASLATQAALTGHVVLSTLHTNDTIGAIPRLVDMGVEKYLLAPTLNLVLAQRLTRRLCQTCKVSNKANQGEESMIRQTIEKMPPAAKKGLPSGNFEIYKPSPEGCKECNGRSYKGRVGIFETLAMTDELEKIILTNISEEELRVEAKRQGMITMFQDGIIKVLNGATSLEELLTVAQETEQE